MYTIGCSSPIATSSSNCSSTPVLLDLALLLPDLMIAKVAESLALRRAFLPELSGLYSTEEIGQADSETLAITPHKRVELPVVSGEVTEAVEERAIARFSLGQLQLPNLPVEQ